MTLEARVMNPAVSQLEHFRLQVNHLSLKNPPTIVQAGNLSEITKTPEFIELCEREPWNVWTDFDGVFTNPWNRSQTLFSLRAGRELVAHAQNLTVFTAKELVGEDSLSVLQELVSSPLVTKSPLSFILYSREKMKRYFSTLAENNMLTTHDGELRSCRIQLVSGLRKIVNKAGWNTIFEDIQRSLEENIPTVVISSSYLDRKRIHQFIWNLSKSNPAYLRNLYYFDTKHLLI